MTLAAKNKLINDMIRENPDVTIKDYLELEKELKAIESETEQILLIKSVNQEARQISRTMNRRFIDRYSEIRI